MTVHLLESHHQQRPLFTPPLVRSCLQLFWKSLPFLMNLCPLTGFCRWLGTSGLSSFPLPNNGTQTRNSMAVSKCKTHPQWWSCSTCIFITHTQLGSRDGRKGRPSLVNLRKKSLVTIASCFIRSIQTHSSIPFLGYQAITTSPPAASFPRKRCFVFFCFFEEGVYEDQN